MGSWLAVGRRVYSCPWLGDGESAHQSVSQATPAPVYFPLLAPKMLTRHLAFFFFFRYTHTKADSNSFFFWSLVFPWVFLSVAENLVLIFNARCSFQWDALSRFLLLLSSLPCEVFFFFFHTPSTIFLYPGEGYFNKFSSFVAKRD